MCSKLVTLTLGFGLFLWGQAEVITTGLQLPQKMALTAQGNFLVSETSLAANSGRISFVTRSGARRSLFEGFPSGTDPVGSGSGPTGLAIKDQTLYIAIGGGDTERNQNGVSVLNPAGTSSPIFSSILAVQFNAAIDSLSGTFTLTTANQQSLADGEQIELADSASGRAKIWMLAKLPVVIPDGTRYRFSNPWGIALSADGGTLWYTDASQDTLVKIDTASGKWQRAMQFPRLPNAGPIGPPMVDVVPTSVRIYGSQLLVSFLTGFPFTPGYARVLAVNPDVKTTEPFIFGITSATDILWRQRPNGASQFFVLEFSQNMTATPPAPGRLVRYDTPTPQTVVSDLQGAVNLAFDPATEEVFILELSGRISKVSAK